VSSEQGTLFVGGLNLNSDEQTLEDHFSRFGPISEGVIVKGREIQRFWGFGFTTFTSPEHASDAMGAMNGESLDGRQICVDHLGNPTWGFSLTAQSPLSLSLSLSAPTPPAHAHSLSFSLIINK
uniref:RRM domain-containing protein n=1 Tax=Lynx canadensis TaxID=61383 RepID=A0A667GAE7_LYNCA